MPEDRFNMAKALKTGYTYRLNWVEALQIGSLDRTQWLCQTWATHLQSQLNWPALGDHH